MHVLKAVESLLGAYSICANASYFLTPVGLSAFAVMGVKRTNVVVAVGAVGQWSCIRCGFGLTLHIGLTGD